ncbi:polyadenylate-binding protein-interacting protein 4-like [Humulus lupulus]|uniref:polyadenylate-binding protein-interacting protein 4-like n=1 Tax=Humulus lupulus TaxID=3486 RepID=UPI002B402FDF|nr:polyadenylate-binding protein-interacting protein 4-like [Humulus lupulus]
MTGSKTGGHGSPWHDLLVYITTCFVGQHVDVHVKNGSIYSGIFHAANEKDFGIILKMARLTKDGSSRGKKSPAESVNKPPAKTLIIPSKELVQVIAKDVSVTSEGFLDEARCEKQQEQIWSLEMYGFSDFAPRNSACEGGSYDCVYVPEKPVIISIYCQHS